MSLKAIADSTKISPRYLNAIERGDFEKLPGGVYDISYIRQYATAIGYDEDELLRFYRAAMPAPEEQEPEVRPSTHSLMGWFRQLSAILLLRENPSPGQR